MHESKCYFKPGENELVRTKIYIEPKDYCAFQATVLYPDGTPVAGALALLYEADGGELIQAGFGVSDSEGRVIFGPLPSSRLYLARVYKNSVKLREIEIRPESGQ